MINKFMNRHMRSTTSPQSSISILKNVPIRKFSEVPFPHAMKNLVLSDPLRAIPSLLLIGGIQSITIVSFLWLFYILSKLFRMKTIFASDKTRLKIIGVTSYSLIEVCFYFYQSYLLYKSDNINSYKVPKLSNDKIEQFINTYIRSVSETDKDPKIFFENWFYLTKFENIGYANIVDWVAFAFYGKHAIKLNQSDLNHVIAIIDKFNHHFQLNIKNFSSIAKTKDRTFMKPFLYPLNMIRKPFLYYFVTDWCFHLITSCYFNLYFKCKYIKADYNSTTTENNNNKNSYRCQNISYWVFEPKNASILAKTNKLDNPIIFIHGIGAGLLIYIEFLKYLFNNCNQLKNRFIILIELPWISMCFPSKLFANNTKFPSMNDAIENNFKLIFDQYCIKYNKKCILMGHSFGTIIMSWIIKSDLLKREIYQSIFIDPVCFELYEPDLIYNFVYRHPVNVNQLFLWNFICREFGIAYVIARHFWWFEGILLSNHCPKNTKVLLSESDCLINAKSIRRYFDYHKIDYHWKPNQMHGGFLLDRPCWDVIVNWINEK